MHMQGIAFQTFDQAIKTISSLFILFEKHHPWNSISAYHIFDSLSMRLPAYQTLQKHHTLRLSSRISRETSEYFHQKETKSSMIFIHGGCIKGKKENYNLGIEAKDVHGIIINPWPQISAARWNSPSWNLKWVYENNRKYVG